MNRLRLNLLAGMVLLAFSGTAHAASYTSKAERLLAAGEPREALIELQNAVRSNPSDGQAHYLLAKLDLQLGDGVSAEREAEAAESNGYDVNKSLTLVLDSYMAQGRYVDLLHKFPLGGATGDRGARIEVGRGNAELVLNRQDEAADDFTHAHQLDPKLNLALFGLEDIALAQHHLTVAQKYLDQAVTLDPTSNEGQLRKARLMLAQGKAQQAITLLQQLVKTSPSNISNQLLLAQALVGTNQFEAARVSVKKVLAVVPNSVEAIYLTAALDVSAQNWTAAQNQLQRISSMMSVIPGAYFLDALTLEHLGQLGAAEQAAEHFAARAPADPRGQRLLADLEIRTGHPKEALRQIAAAPAAQRNDLPMMMLDGIARRDLGDLPAAAKDFEQAIAMAPKLPAPRVALSAVQIAEGNARGAVMTLQQATNLAPKSVPIKRLLMQAAIGAGDDSTARSALKSLRSAEGSDAEPALAGELDLAEFKLEDAKAEYTTVLNANPQAENARLALARIAALQGDQQQETSLLRQALTNDPANAEAVGALSNLLTSQGKIDAAIDVVQAAHNAAPNNLGFITDLVKLDLFAKKPDAASQLLSGLDPSISQKPQILAMSAEVALAQGNQQAAHQALQATITAAPQATGPILALAHLDIAAKDEAAAINTLTDGLNTNPHSLPLMEALTALELKDHGVKPALAKAAKLASDPDHLPEARILPGDIFLATHQPAEAANAFSQAYQAAPSPALLGALVAALDASGQKAEAEAKLKDAVANHPHNGAFDDMLAQAEIADGNLDAAKTQLQAALTRNPNDGAALNNLAWIEQKQGASDAEALAVHAYFVAPLPQVADTLGWILYDKSQTKKALPLLRQAHDAMPSDPSVAYHYAAALAKDGQEGQAKSVLKPLVTTPDQFADKDAAKSLLARLK